MAGEVLQGGARGRDDIRSAGAMAGGCRQVRVPDGEDKPGRRRRRGRRGGGGPLPAAAAAERRRARRPSSRWASGGADWSAVRRCALSADWPAGESCVPEEAGGAAGRSPLRGVPEEAAGDAPSAPAQGGGGRRLQRKKGDTNRKEKGGLGFLLGPMCIRLSCATAHGATQSRQCMWRDSALPRQLPDRGRSSVAA